MTDSEQQAAPVDFSGKWKHVRTDNFDAFGEAVGMPWLVRKIAAKSTPEMHVIQNGNHFHVIFKSMAFTDETHFDVGYEFIFSPPKSGVNMKSLAHWEGEKLMVDSTPDDPEKAQIVSQRAIRELNGPDETILTTIVRTKAKPDVEISMTRVFARVG